MDQSFVYANVRSRARQVHDALAQWQVDHREAEHVLDVEDINQEMSQVVTQLETLVSRLAEERKQPINNAPVVFVYLVHELLEDVAQSWAMLDEVAGRLWQQGYKIDNATLLKSTLERLTHLQQELRTSWLLGDRARMEQSKQEIRAGQFRVL